VKKNIRIGTIGLDEITSNTLAFFFKKHCPNRCEITSKEEANVLIINMAHNRSGADYDHIQKEHPSAQLIFMMLNPIKNKDGQYYFLRKPIIANDLLDIINDIEENLTSHLPPKKTIAPAEKTVVEKALVKENTNSLAQEAVASPTSSGHAAELVFKKNKMDLSRNTAKVHIPENSDINNAKFNPDDYYLGSILQAYKSVKNSSGIIKISRLWKPIWFFPESNEVYVSINNNQLRSICAISNKSKIASREIKIETCHGEWELKSSYKAEFFHSIESFIWRASLYTSRGRIPDFIDIKQTVVILSWPNITRLDLTPNALKLIAYWAASPRSIEDAVEKLGIEHSYVFSLFTAMYTTGHVSLANKISAEHKVKINTAPPKTLKNLFSKVITKLTW